LVAERERTYLDWFFRVFSATPGVPTRAATDEYVRCYTRQGAMASAFARYRGTSREIEHNTQHLSRPLDLPILGIGGERLLDAWAATGLQQKFDAAFQASLPNEDSDAKVLRRHLTEFPLLK
jgi:hypothetical protein